MRASRGANATACTRMSSEPHSLRDEFERGADLLIARDIQRQGERAQGLRQRHDPFLELVVGVGEGEGGAFALHGLGDAPGDGPVRGNADDEGALAREKTHVGRQGADWMDRRASVRAPAWSC